MNKLLSEKSRVRSSDEVAEDYLDLIREFPLRPLRSESEYRSAGAIIDRFIGRDDLTEGQRDYLAGLIRFIEDYQQERRTRQLRRLSPMELLKHLIKENDMNTTDLGYILGSRGLASEVLNGKRGLSKTLIAKLSQRFGVDQALFLE